MTTDYLPEVYPNYSKTTVSTPGKVLITGGYLVLEQKFSGIVIATNARFFTTCGTPLHKPIGTRIHVNISLPQFLNTEKTSFVKNKYEALYNGSTFLYDLLPLANNYTLSFAELTVSFSLSFVEYFYSVEGGKQEDRVVNKDVDITIKTDAAFYSASGKDSGSFPASFECRLDEINKTGLGSSAALVSSIVGSVFIHFGINNLNLIHNASQVCHSIVQGKIGSGFDISCAIFGSQVYSRFSPALISFSSFKNDYVSLFASIIHGKWDSVVRAFQLPPSLILMLGDVNFGSNTPQMVKKVLEKRAECDFVWESLGELNSLFLHDLEILNQKSIENPNVYFNFLSKDIIWKYEDMKEDKQTGSVDMIFERIFKTFNKIRFQFRKLSEMVQNVMIEPPEQQKLIDETLEIPSVLFSGVPGAGGYDAIFCVVLNREAEKKVGELWNKRGVSKLRISASNDGLRVEGT
jgi:phosphomevalonate kinase